MGLNKEHVKIGILAKRGVAQTLKRWSTLEGYLNERVENYHFKIIPLDFSSLAVSVEKKEVDFILTNTMQYVQLENKHGVSRMLTLENLGKDGEGSSKRFGGVIFTKKDNHKVEKIKDLKGLVFGAVSPDSFGGWLMAHEVLEHEGIKKENLKLKFLNSHDKVVHAVLNGSIEAGTVRTDTLERMASEGLINLEDIKVINAQKYEGFSYLLSSKLYPEWPFAKLKHTSDQLGNLVLSALIQMPSSSQAAQTADVKGWTIPLDYSSVHTLLKKLRIYPYDQSEFSVKDVFEKYIFWIYFLGAVLIFIALAIMYEMRINYYLKSFNFKLENQVRERTRALEIANAKLKVYAHTDPLTGIYSRGYFMNQARGYFDMAKRNSTPLQVLSLDIDYFKKINDTYGHQVGDEMLKRFTQTIEKLLRKSDIFGRIGGEEFVICLQNTADDGAQTFSKKILEEVEKATYTMENGEQISCTVSIGVAHLKDEKSFDVLLKNSDMALYEAKESGRNRVKTY